MAKILREGSKGRLLCTGRSPTVRGGLRLILGLLREADHRGSRALIELGVKLQEVVEDVERVLPRGEARPNQDMTLTPRAQRVIDLAYDEARQLGNNFIGTEHLLLGLVREHDGLAGRALARFGVVLEPLREAIRQIHHADGLEAGTSVQPEAGTRHRTIPDWEHGMVMSRVREWALWANELGDPTASLSAELDGLKEKIESKTSALQRSMLLALCLEASGEGNLQDNENWKKLRLTAEQAEAIAEIGAEVRKLLTSE